jgi:SPP1 gp7 family putative phage head morphogenesis protein
MASNPPEPRVVTVLREFKQALALREATQMQEMARRWLAVEQALDARIMALVREVDALRTEGLTPSASKIFQLQRYRELLRQAEAEFTQYATWATAEIIRQQEQLGTLGLQQAAAAIDAAYYPRLAGYFDRLPVEAIQTMIGLAGNGQPIGELLVRRMIRDAQGQPLPGVWERLTRTLIESTAIGRNPRDTARLMRDNLTGGLQKALVIARTEQLRVYRYAAIQQYQASGVVLGHKRLTAHDSRVCIGCLADEGTVYPITEAIPDHPNGRCTGVPVVRGMPEVQWQAGEGSFAAGTRAKSLHTGAFVWADSTDADYESLAADSFNIRAKGGVRMTTSGAGLALDGPVIVDGMTFTYTSPITITGVLTNVRLLYYQVP